MLILCTISLSNGYLKSISDAYIYSDGAKGGGGRGGGAALCGTFTGAAILT